MTASIPARPEDVTAEWLSAVLDADVRGITELDRHAGTTGRLRLALDLAPGADGPASVFVKLPPFDESQQKLVANTDMGRREARFYAGPAAEVPMRIPRAFHAAAGEEPTEYVMVLEDLVAAGCRLTSRVDPDDTDRSGALIDGLARMHAHFWEDPRFDDELAWVPPAMRGSYGAKLIGRAKEQFADQLPPVFAELCDLYVEHHAAIAEILDDGERTLIHGDTHTGNQLVDGDQVGLYDWAVISASPGVRDVAIYLGNSCPTELRQAGQDAWLRSYHQVLVDAGVAAPSFETLWDRYRRCVVYAWVATATTASMGSRWQPIEVGMAGLQRATQTCADLDTLSALRDAL